MFFEWLLDDLKGNHILCLTRERCLFLRGTLSPEGNGKRLWQPFPDGEPTEVCGNLEIARHQCEEMVRQLG